MSSEMSRLPPITHAQTIQHATMTQTTSDMTSSSSKLRSSPQMKRLSFAHVSRQQHQGTVGSDSPRGSRSSSPFANHNTHLGFTSGTPRSGHSGHSKGRLDAILSPRVGHKSVVSQTGSSATGSVESAGSSNANQQHSRSTSSSPVCTPLNRRKLVHDLIGNPATRSALSPCAQQLAANILSRTASLPTGDILTLSAHASGSLPELNIPVPEMTSVIPKDRASDSKRPGGNLLEHNHVAYDVIKNKDQDEDEDEDEEYDDDHNDEDEEVAVLVRKALYERCNQWLRTVEIEKGNPTLEPLVDSPVIWETPS